MFKLLFFKYMFKYMFKLLLLFISFGPYIQTEVRIFSRLDLTIGQ